MGKRRSRLTQFFIPLFGFFVVLYTTHQAFSGDRGFFAWYKLQQQVSQLKEQNASLSAQLTLMEAKVARLNLKNPDVDYLDEQIRRTLPVAKQSEKVIYLTSTAYGS